MITEQRKRVLEAALNVYKTKGVKFTMDDLATELGMSKKTIYTIFRDKGTLLYQMVEFGFDNIKKAEDEVINNPDLDVIGKIKNILGVMPESYIGVDFTQLYLLKGKYPKAYKRMQERLESGWEQTLSLIDQGIEEGVIRDVNKVVFQIAHEATIERFLMGDELQKNKISYMDAMNELVSILVEGILV